MAPLETWTTPANPLIVKAAATAKCPLVVKVAATTKCPLVAKAAATTKCHQAVSQEMTVIRMPTTKSLVRVVAYSVVL